MFDFRIVQCTTPVASICHWFHIYHLIAHLPWVELIQRRSIEASRADDWTWRMFRKKVCLHLLTYTYVKYAGTAAQ